MITRKLFTFSIYFVLFTQIFAVPIFAKASYNKDIKDINVADIVTRKVKKHNEHSNYNKSKNISIAAKVLNMPEEDLKKQINDGKSLYDILKDAGKLQEFKDQTLIELRSHLDDEVKRGRLTPENANKLYDAKKSKIESWDGSIPNSSEKKH